MYWTALHWAAQMQDIGLINLLLEFKADPNRKDFEGATPLHVAGDGKSSECVQILINHGADPSIRNDFGVKAGDLCIRRGHEKNLIPRKIE